MEKEQTICGYSLSAIRKAYFGGKLTKLLSDILADGQYGQEEWTALEAHLETLKAEGDEKKAQFAKSFSDELGMEIKPPSVEELVAGENQGDLEAWLRDRDTALGYVKEKMKDARNKFKQGQADMRTLQDLALELSFWRTWISQDVVYKRQLWKRRLTKIIDTYGVSRKEAEDRSELTPEYRDYKLASNFYDDVENFIISARRGYTE